MPTHPRVKVNETANLRTKQVYQVKNYSRNLSNESAPKLPQHPTKQEHLRCRYSTAELM